MIKKKCNDQYKYGCTLEVEVENKDELDQYFYKKNTFTGSYHQNVCKDCVRKHRVSKYKDGSWNWRLKFGRDNYYKDKTYSIGKIGKETE